MERLQTVCANRKNTCTMASFNGNLPDWKHSAGISFYLLRDRGHNVGKVFVGNLPFDATEVELHHFFSTDLDVGVVKVVRDRETGRSRGFAFVEVDDPERMITQFNGRELEGRLLKVDRARERPDRTGSSNKGVGARLFRRVR